MDKYEHAELLRQALEESGLSREHLTEATGRNYRTISNWISRTSPTMPSSAERTILRTVFRRELGRDYDKAGDEVERALRRSPLIEWRQDAVLSFYKRNLHEQREEATG